MQLKQKLLLILSFLTMIFIIQACRKYDFFGKSSGEFKVEDAKEWYYGVFKKSDAFITVSDKNAIAPFVTRGVYIGRQQTSKTFYKKYPYWNKAINYSLGSLQVVEMPLQLEEKALVLPGMQHLSKLEKTKIAEGSITKLLFFKQTDGAITTRIVTLIPTLQYLKAKKFDISDNNLKKPDGSFEGFLMVQDWQGGLINLFEIKNAKYTRKIKISKFKKTANNDTGIELLSSSSECGWVITTTVVQYCVSTNGSSGDVPPGDPTCTEWQEYTDENWEYIPCEEEEIDPFTECIQMGNDNDYCNCLVYSVGCQGEDDPPGDDPPQYDEDVIDSVEVKVTDSCFQNVIDEINSASSLRTSIGSILHETFSYWGERDLYIKQRCNLDTSVDAETSPGTLVITIALNECALQNASMEYIAASLYHEILHAFFDAEGRTSELIQHNTMANKYIEAMASTLMEKFPNLSALDAEALAWGGLQQTQAWQNLMQTDPSRALDILFLNKKHKQGDWGTQCN